MVTFFDSPARVPRSRIACALGFVLAGVLWSRTVWALEYDYDAPAGCPSRDAFLSEVGSRLRYPAEQSTVERLQVSVRHQQGFEASFVLIEPGQPPVTRTLTADACDEAMQALALGAALALDARYREVRGLPDEPPVSPTPPLVPPAPATAGSQPSAPQAPAAPAAAPVATGASNPPASAAPAAAPVATAVTQPTPAVNPPPAPTAPVAPASVGKEPGLPPVQEPEQEEAKPRWAARAGAFVATGYGPDPSFGPSLGFLLRKNRLELALEGFFGAERQAGGDGQSAEFWVIGGRLYPCLRWPLAGGLWLRGCGALEFSAVHAEGIKSAEVVSVEEHYAPYWALGGVAVLEAPLTQSLGLEFHLGAQFPLNRHQFSFTNGDGSLHEYPVVTARGQLAICYAF